MEMLQYPINFPIPHFQHVHGMLIIWNDCCSYMNFSFGSWVGIMPIIEIYPPKVCLNLPLLISSEIPLNTRIKINEKRALVAFVLVE